MDCKFLKVSRHIFVVLFLVLISFVSNLSAQVKNSGYRSSYFMEKVWSKTKNEYLLIETIQKTSKFVFTQDGIYFKKGGGEKWLYNKWTFDKSEQSENSGSTMDIYFDERGQKVVIYYKTSEVWYFHGYDPNTKRYNNLTLYMDCSEDSELLSEIGLSNNTTSKTKTSGKFRVDMNYVAIYDNSKEEWSEWKKGYNTFVINSNENKDIIHIKPSGEEVNYRRISQSVERKATSDGKEYQIINCVDGNGDKFQFQVFDDYKIGIKMIYATGIIQFAQIE